MSAAAGGRSTAPLPTRLGTQIMTLTSGLTNRGGLGLQAKLLRSASPVRNCVPVRLSPLPPRPVAATSGEASDRRRSSVRRAARPARTSSPTPMGVAVEVLDEHRGESLRLAVVGFRVGPGRRAAGGPRSGRPGSSSGPRRRRSGRDRRDIIEQAVEGRPHHRAGVVDVHALARLRTARRSSRCSRARPGRPSAPSARPASARTRPGGGA